MDPLAAIGLAGNIITFIDFSYKIISGMNEVLSSSNGMILENANLDVLAKDLDVITQDLISDAPPRTENERQLHTLAASCHELSRELLQTLQGLKVSNKRSKWQGVKVKWQSMRKEKEVNALERRLNSYQSEILIRLQFMFSLKNENQTSLVKDHLNALQSEGKALRNDMASRLADLQNDISSLLGTMKPFSTPHDSSSRDGESRLAEGTFGEPSLGRLSDCLSRFQSMRTLLSWQNHVLARLVFSSIYHRCDVIEHADHGTFSWMLEDSDSKGIQSTENSESNPIIEQDVTRDNTRHRFLAWLNSGRHIFYISGKPGSGKSTLMKYLGEAPRVQKELHVWAGDQSLLFAQFFFWNSGEKLQMSLEGLYRSLLFEVCRQAPDLIPRIFPDLWKDLSSGFAPPQQTPFRLEEIKFAFNRLIQESHKSKITLCFFIDGLDEFEGDDTDYWHIARDLQSWTQSEKIKLCVSSRPYIPFLQTFSSPGNIQIPIHQLTREDIRQFGLAMFEKDPNFDRIKNNYQSLVDNIADISNGVFLWARLVVRSLLRSIGYHGTTEDLYRKLLTMPKGLNELFDQLLGSIDSDDQHLSDILFLLAIQNFCPWPHPVVDTAIAYSWLEDLADPNFPWNRPMVLCFEEDMKQRLQRVACSLDRLSRGLLEMIPIGSRLNTDYYAYKVRFFHRTARDYIAGTRQAQMRSRVPNVDVHGDILRLSFAQFKFAPPTAPYFGCNEWEDHLDSAIKDHVLILLTILYFAIRDGYAIPAHLFENIYNVFQGHAQPAANTDTGQSCHSKCRLEGDKGENLPMSFNWRPIPLKSYHPFCFLDQMIGYGFYGFLSTELKDRLRQQCGLSSPNLLLDACTTNQNADLVRELLSEGRSPTEMVHIEHLSVPSNSNHNLNESKKEGNAFSVWMLFLYHTACHATVTASQFDASFLEMFLQFDVERDVVFIMRNIRRGHDNADSGEEFTVSLLELTEVTNPQNAGTIRSIFQKEAALEGRTNSELGSLCSSSPPESTFARYCEKIDDPVKMLRGCTIDSVFTSSERLDRPFAYKIS